MLRMSGMGPRSQQKAPHFIYLGELTSGGLGKMSYSQHKHSDSDLHSEEKAKYLRAVKL